MPLHCRRCYVTFPDEGQLTEHSRSTNSCIVQIALPIDGFNKDQEKELKGRRGMFRAGTEVEKWKIDYLILFPDTPLGGIPSPRKTVSYINQAPRLTFTKITIAKAIQRPVN
jgi:hypothetical protein